EFERTIQEIEHFAETDPELFLDQLDSINKAVSHVEYRVFLDEDLASQVNLDEDLTPFQEKVVEDPDVLSSLRTRDNTQVVKTIRQENQIDTPFIMRLYKFEAAGEEMLLVSFGDLLFLNELQSNFRDWIIIIVILYLILGVWSFYYLKKRLGEPITELRDIAF